MYSQVVGTLKPSIEYASLPFAPLRPRSLPFAPLHPPSLPFAPFAPFVPLPPFAPFSPLLFPSLPSLPFAPLRSLCSPPPPFAPFAPLRPPLLPSLTFAPLRPLCYLTPCLHTEVVGTLKPSTEYASLHSLCWWLIRVTLVVNWLFLPQNFGPVVGTYEGLLPFSECTWCESIFRWWGNLHYLSEPNFLCPQVVGTLKPSIEYASLPFTPLRPLRSPLPPPSLPSPPSPLGHYKYSWTVKRLQKNCKRTFCAHRWWGP